MYAVALYHMRLSLNINALVDFKCFTFQFIPPHIYVTEVQGYSKWLSGF